MRLLRRLPLFLAAVFVVLASSAMPAPASNTLATFVSTMKGSNEVPGPGDLTASGSTAIIMNAVSGQVCYRVTARIESGGPITAGHIHVGPAGVAGPVVIPFPNVNSGTAGPNYSGCTTASPALVQAIIANPSGYYTNVHDPAFPAGVMRGQLVRIS
jgi:hypothetical protein